VITGAVDVTLTTEQGVSILLQVVDSRDGMYRVEFKAIVVSTYIMNVTVASQLIPTSLYRVQVQSIDHTSKVHITDSDNLVVACISTDNNFHAVDYSSSSSYQASESLFSKSVNKVGVESAAKKCRKTYTVRNSSRSSVEL